MSEDRAEPDAAIPEDETYEPPEVSDFGSLVELTLSGGNQMTDMGGWAVATSGGGGS
jgi:hypothetical protein